MAQMDDRGGERGGEMNTRDEELEWQRREERKSGKSDGENGHEGDRRLKR